MELAVRGKQMSVGDALRTHVEEKLSDIDSKFFNRAFDTNVTFSPEGSAFVKTHISLKVGKDIMVSATATETEAYLSFDVAAAKIAKQLRKYKNRLRDHHERTDHTPESEMIKARDYTLASEETNQAEQQTEEPSGKDPVIIAEMPMQIQKMSVSDAVMRLDLGGNAALLFRNPKNNSLNMVYRRADGNIGWVEPQDDLQKSVAAE